MTKIAQQQQEADNQAAAQMQQAQLEQQLQIHQEEREDIQKQEVDVVMMKTQGQIEIDNNKARNEMHLQNMKG